MMRTTLPALLIAGVFAALAPHDAAADLTGQWYGVGWDATQLFQTTNVDLQMTESEGSGLADLYIPQFGMFHQTLPLMVAGNTLVIGDPSVLGFVGTIDGDIIVGETYQGSSMVGTWHIEREYTQPPIPGPAPGPSCSDLPPMECLDGGMYDCSELVQFEPSEGWGYLDYPVGGETWDDQRYSWVRRDLAYLIMYATAKVACKTADWDYGNLAPLGLGDGSQADGMTPGTDVGVPRHPAGSHMLGLDIDTAYYQIYSPDNLMRPIGDHYDGIQDQYHLVGQPFLLDIWRNALFVAYLSEHPRLRVIGVDGVVGPILDDALDQLVALGWIDANLRHSIPLAYETEDGGLGWFLHHHTHLHISFWYDITASPDGATPEVARLHDCYPNPFNPRTTLGFTLARPAAVRLSVHDATGRLVQRLIDGETCPAGLTEVDWRGRDLNGRAVASGVYFYRLEVGGQIQTSKMVLLR